jgi:hypothetical protein
MRFIEGSQTMNEPKGTDILSTLIMLLAEQEQVKIKFELEVSKQ